ncbi:flagellar motor protein MotB [Paenibacillus mendelii]|uniref:Flagellar motor protein MotB n=1 Tax=Paenibacillus mendelii TaxID=206163 RepID=A0ABV6J4H6_9BACL|nr:flagellar motor protein MotB [Paenibacillus mendelii]MCQ6561694.1 flagellar motor protein MotB [Paenibacillus mendelii]
MSKKYKSDHHDEHMDESWLIPYADLLTLLLAMFIVLYAMSSVDSKKFEDMSKAFNIAFNTGVGVLDNTTIMETGKQMDDADKRNRRPSDETNSRTKDREALMKQEQQELEELKKQLDKYIQTNGMTTQLDTKLNQSQLMITISDKALFASGSAAVKPEARNLAVAISDMFDKYPGYEIVVSGHTDNEPISNSEFKSNWDLSSSRAIRFMDILLSNKSLDPRLFSAIGYGEHRPVDSNNNALGRAKNRRVEVSIIRKFIDPENSSPIPATPKQ